MNETNFFNNWKQFIIKQPDELVLNHFDIVKNNTNLNGDLKHKNNNEIIKVFSLFITHNYGSYIYELCHFLKYIKDLNLSLYEVMIVDSQSLVKQIKKNQFKKFDRLYDQMTIKLENYSFTLNYSRVSTYLLILDFIEEFLKLDEIYNLDNKIDNIFSYNDIKDVSNDISKKIYNYLKDLIPSSYLQTISDNIGNAIIKDKNNHDHIIISEDISDEFILNFWINNCSNDNDLTVRKFSTAAELCMTYRKAVKINNSSLKKIDNPNDEDDPWNKFSQKQINDFLVQITNDSSGEIFDGIKKIESFQNKNMNILKKKEINELLIFSKYKNLTFELPLTVFRICVFGEIQSKIIEAQRRKKLNLEILYDQFQENLAYKNLYQTHTDLSSNIDIIKGIVFYKLWIFKDNNCIKFVKEFLSPHEIKTLDNFVEDYKKNYKINFIKTGHTLCITDNSSKENTLIDDIVYKLREILENNYHENKFVDFKNNLEKLNSLNKKFRRKGFEFKNPSNDNLETLNILYESLSDTKELLNQFSNNVRSKITDLKFQFNFDKIIFFTQFNTLYEGEKI